MSTIGPDSGCGALAQWPADDWENAGEPDTTAVPPRVSPDVPEVEVVPSRWTAQTDEMISAPMSQRRWWILAAIAGAAIVAALWWLLNGSTTDGPTATIAPAAPLTQEPPAPFAQPDFTTEVLVPTTNTPVPTGQPATGTATDVVAGFAADYANPGAGKDDWLNRVSRWTSPQLTAGYRLTDPNRLPDAKFERLSLPLNNDSATVVFDAYYDTMTLEIRVAFLHDRWQVIAALDTQPVDDVSPPASTPRETTPYIPPDIGAPHP